MGCRLITGPIFKNKRMAYLADIKQKKEEIMPLIHVIVVLVVVGVILYLINSYIPMAGSIKSILNAVVIIVVVLWLLTVFGLIGELSNIRVGK
jgi:sterol desaturase/sphingolipid hydroxylase (fatty acid hydroxylase superfamily)